MQNKIIIASATVATAIIIYLGFSILAGLNTLNAIQHDQRAISSEIRDTLNVTECYTIHGNYGDNLPNYYQCLYDNK